MKIINKIIILFVIAFWIFSIASTEVSASKYGDGGKIEWLNSVWWRYQELTNKKDFWEAATDIWYKILNWARLVFSGVLIILIIYAWAQMVMSTGTDDDQLGKSRRAILYSIVGLIFINFPLEIYQSLYAENKGSNLFIYQEWFKLLLWRILTAIEILIWWLAVFLIVLEWIKLIANGGDEESLTKARKRLVWVVWALIFLWFIQIYLIIPSYMKFSFVYCLTYCSIFPLTCRILLYIFKLRWIKNKKMKRYYYKYLYLSDNSYMCICTSKWP